MSTPLLSICIPTYNRARRLDLLLQSMALQVCQEGLEQRVEIVVSDNASTDGTKKIGAKWAAQHVFIRYFRNSWNIGGEPNQLRAISRGTGKFVWVFGDDDRIRKGGIARVLSHLTPGVTQLFLNYRCVDPQGKCLVRSRIDPEMPLQLPTVELIKQLGFMSVFALISTHVFDREIFLKIGNDFLLEISPWYVLNTAMLIAFHDQVCHVVEDPVLDYTIGNERLPHESAIYSRVLQLLKTLNWLEINNKIDADFLSGCHERGAHERMTGIYFREELYGSLSEISRFWALPGREDWHVIREFIQWGPGFWEARNMLNTFFVDDFKLFLTHKKPVIHYWHGKAWVPAFSILFSSDDRGECEAFDELMGKWPVEFAHESILSSRLPEEKTLFENIDIFMAPFRPHRLPSSSLNSGFRKTLAPRVLILDEICSPVIGEVIKRIDDWEKEEEIDDDDEEGEDAPAPRLLFETASSNGTGAPKGLLGLYVRREPLVHLGAFENLFQSWNRHRLLADAGFRLRCKAWAVDGGEVSPKALQAWFAANLPVWVRILRRLHPRPLSEHGLNITERAHLEAKRKEKRLNPA